ncbi:AAA family ATPase [Brevibacterium casei]|uniref:MobF family relaxase n=1 Tax=Brevibacterium TaxID=1696 RepID=UPI00031F15FD|nr:MobF family relaxase [Brevibacterium casei]MCT2181657.1 AAA family ATPase [Brevibacterium casei]QQT69966.1 AAA family ATPase [Brevibacterium casei]QZE25794.1 AAA family ATPase [Brevibacterium casei]
MIPFRGTGADALRYVEADRSRADDYYLGAEATVAQFAALDASGMVTAEGSLGPAAYAAWVDWTNPLTGEQMGRPRRAGSDRQASPRFMEMVINAPKSLSIAAALHPEVSAALDVAQQDALSEIRRWLAQHSVTRVGSLGAQEVVPIESMQVVGITHRTSRAGDPHRHIHMQIGTRVYAAGKWRGLDTAALFRQQGAIRALGTAVIAASPELAQVLDRHGLTLDPVSGEVVELEPFNAVMSKRGEQVHRNLDRLEAEWNAAHPGESMGPVVASRLRAEAWAYQRRAKKPTTLREEEAWVSELREAGYDPEHLTRKPAPAPLFTDDLSVQRIASRALDRCAAAESAWTRHTVQEHATEIITEAGVRGTPAELRELIAVATTLALQDCFSILPPDAAAPEHVAHLTSLRVVQVETELRDLITARAQEQEPEHADVREHSATLGQRLDSGQLDAAAAVASADPLVIVEGAAGAGKTTMLATAIRATEQHGGRVRVVAPTKRAAEVAHQELGVPAESVAALVHAHGWRWNADGVWTRLAIGDTDPATGATYTGPPQAAQLHRGERIVVDEAGMLDQDTALALFTVAAETGATLALVGDRAQLPAVGRGGVLDMAAQLRGRTFDMAVVHRFTDPAYAEVTVQMRDRRDPGEVFDRLRELGLIRLHTDADELREHLATSRQDGEAVTVASNEEAARQNDRIRDERTRAGVVDDTTTTAGSDGLNIGRGDLIQTRKNRTDLGVANRQQWIVQHVEQDGSLWVRDAHSDRKREHSIHLPAEYVREHSHLSYAATAYGVQGVTVPASHTVLTESMGGAAVYVGMTRGRNENTLHLVAESMADACAQFIEAMERDRADRGLAEATQRAAEAVRGLVADGPVKLVNDEVARLMGDAERAEQQAALWQQAADALTELQAKQRDERDQARQAAETAARQLGRVRTGVAAPLTEQAAAALSEWQTANNVQQAARDRLNTAERFGKRRATAEYRTTQVLAQDAKRQLTTAWGAPPRWNEGRASWVERVTRPRIDADPRVIEATEQNEAAAKAVRKALESAPWPRMRVYARIFGPEAVAKNRAAYLDARPRANAERQAHAAGEARAEVETLRALSPVEAVRRIEQARAIEQAQREAADRALNERQRQFDPRSRAHDSGPSYGGPSLAR